MDYKEKSLVTLIALASIMVGIGFVVNYFHSGITGGAITGGIACYDNADCDDGITCTIDSCKNAGDGNLAFCVNQPVDFCQDGDGCCPRGCSSVNDNDCS